MGGFWTGITPARAGKSKNGGRGGSGRENYPRSCGEEHVSSSKRAKATELPPLVRGRAPAIKRTKSPYGITPARAGKSCHAFTFS